jgi:circadian clock protein KaiB
MSELKRKLPDKYSGKPANRGRPEYILRLFVSGILQNSVRAIRNITRICEEHLKDNYELEVIDIYQRPDLATSEQIIVVPVMIIKSPLPERRIIGDLSNVQTVLEALNCL